MVSFIPKKLSPQEVRLMELEFNKVESDIEQSEQIWKQMHDFFGTSSIENDVEFYKDYFRWYTELSWRFLQNRDYDFVVNIAIARQIPMAILLGYDVWKEIMWYLAFKAELVSDMQSVYSKMKNALMSSKAVVGIWQGKNYTMQDLVKDTIDANNHEDSIKEAEFKSKILQIYIPSNDERFEEMMVSDPASATRGLIGIVNFFLGVEVDKIWYVVDLYTHPELSTNTPKLAPSTEEIEPLRPVASFVSAKSEPTPTLQQIKTQIEAGFTKDSEGNFENIEGVMQKLAELSDKYNDASIADVLYFDEESGKFKWNI